MARRVRYYPQRIHPYPRVFEMLEDQEAFENWMKEREKAAEEKKKSKEGVKISFSLPALVAILTILGPIWALIYPKMMVLINQQVVEAISNIK